MFTREAPQADVLIVGLGAQYSYGSSNNTLIGAVGATVPPRTALTDRCCAKAAW
jgi:hypothetical protein